MKENKQKEIFSAIATNIHKAGVDRFDPIQERMEIEFVSTYGKFKIKIHENAYVVLAYFYIKIPEKKSIKDELENYIKHISSQKRSRPCYGEIVFDRSQNIIFYKSRIKCDRNITTQTDNVLVKVLCEAEQFRSRYTVDFIAIAKGRTAKQELQINKNNYIKQKIYFWKKTKKISRICLLFDDLLSENDEYFFE